MQRYDSVGVGGGCWQRVLPGLSVGVAQSQEFGKRVVIFGAIGPLFGRDDVVERGYVDHDAIRSRASSSRNCRPFSLVSSRRPSEVIETSSAVRGRAYISTRSCSSPMDLTGAAARL